MPIKVSIIEDDADLRSAVEQIIASAPDLHCASSHPNAEHALKHLPECHPDVALVDIRLPGMDGIELVRQLRICLPQLLAIMLTGYWNDDLIFQSLQAGAVGYLLKRATGTQILDAIREVHTGGSPMTPEIARRVATHFREQPAPLVGSCDHGLTAREREILQLITQGKSSKEVAAASGIAVSTVSNHLRNIYAKLAVTSRTAAIAKLHQQGP